jgi:hypothetical protein
MINWLRKNKPSIQQKMRQEIPFSFIIALLIFACYLLYPIPEAAMWLGFGIAAYSAIANDSIQTLGTFLSSNRKLPWWILWIFIGGVFAIIYANGWIQNGGDVSFGRLTNIPQPTEFQFLTLSAPIILLILTRFRMPVSTTFLLLSTFSSTVVIQKMLTKTFLGYIVAFTVAILVWSVIAYIYHHREFSSRRYNKRNWRILQMCSTAFLWSTWIMHDTANVAVFLPRTLSFEQMLTALLYIFTVIGIIMFLKGGRIQVVVTEKTDITDIRAATIIDFVYALVLLVFKQMNNIPMSTTWVFLGLLAGREIALTLMTRKPEIYSRTAKLVFKDIVRAGLGLLISLLIVLFVM